MLDSSVATFQQPDAFIAPKNVAERREWFNNYIKWIMSHYDRRQYFNGELENEQEYPVDKYEKFMRYYMGRQKNKQYKWATTTVQNNPLRVIWINGQKISTLIDFLDGSGKLMIENMKITVKAISRETQNKRTEMLEALRTKMYLRKDFEMFEQMGVGFKPVGDKDKEFHNVEEAERWANMDYQEESAVWGGKIATDIYKRNHLPEVFAEALRLTWICGIVGMHNYVYNGRVITEKIEPMQLIWDNSDGYDSFNRKGRFAGFIEYLDPSQILARYHSQLSAKEIQEIKDCKNSTAAELLPGIGRVRGYLPWGNGIKISKVTVYWKGRRNLGWKQATENEWGHKPFYKVKEGEDGDYYDECVYQGTLLGNRWLVDCGVAPNQVKDLYNPGESDLPIKIFAPNLTMGETNSVVSKLHQIQDLVDYYTNEIKRVVARNIGKGMIFFANKFKGATDPSAVIGDLQQFGIHFAQTADGEPGDSRVNEKIGEPIDMTLDPNIRELAALRAEQERIMESIVNLSPISMGNQQQYVSQGAQQATISQANISTVSIMNGFVKFAEIVLQHATNMGKIVHSLEDGMVIPIAGNRGREFLKETTEFSNEDLGIYIHVLDIIDEQGRIRLQNMAQALAQNQQLSFLDWVHIERARTYTEILDYMELVFKRQERDAKQQAAMQQAMAELEMMRQDQANRQSIQGKLAATKMQVDGKLAETEMKTQADLLKAGATLGAQSVAA